MKHDKGFDFPAFYRALQATVESKGVSWKQLAQHTGVSPTTLARMASGRKPDAASIAALCAWAGLNLSDFVHSELPKRKPETVAVLAQALRADPSLAPREAEALETMFKAAYFSLRKKKE
ncbi:MAG: helix-turn-helix transcriptional regulator [Betaproteobacteria bacterium]|nr:helix-turn-helix transcriptional regulator [Betaproteobacteria bacterium]